MYLLECMVLSSWCMCRAICLGWSHSTSIRILVYLGLVVVPRSKCWCFIWCWRLRCSVHFNTFPDRTDTYDSIKKVLNDYFEPKKDMMREWLQFWCALLVVNESLLEYVSHLKQKSSTVVSLTVMLTVISETKLWTSGHIAKINTSDAMKQIWHSLNW